MTCCGHTMRNSYDLRWSYNEEQMTCCGHAMRNRWSAVGSAWPAPPSRGHVCDYSIEEEIITRIL